MTHTLESVELLALLAGALVLLLVLWVGPVLLGRVWTRRWSVLVAAGGGLCIGGLFGYSLDPAAGAAWLAVAGALSSAAGAGLARLGRWGWTAGLLATTLGVVVVGGTYLFFTLYSFGVR